jgi:hypothetical protein
MTLSSSRAVAAVLVVLGVLAVIAGIMYIAIHAGNLPSFFPGHLKGGSHTGRRTKHGIAAIVVGVVLLALSGLVARAGARHYSHA